MPFYHDLTIKRNYKLNCICRITALLRFKTKIIFFCDLAIGYNLSQIYTEPKTRERFFFSRNLVLHFRKNDSRFREQISTISSSVCSTGVMHGLLHMEVTSYLDLDYTSFMCLGEIKNEIQGFSYFWLCV